MADRCLVILSGGIDSTVTLHHLSKIGFDVQAVTIDYGQTHVREVDCARYQAQQLGIYWTLINLRDLGRVLQSALVGKGRIPDIQDVLGDPQPVTYVPFRNQILLSIAFGIAESIDARFVAYGIQKHDLYSYWDTTPQFAEKFRSLVSENRKHGIELLTPLITYSKEQVVRLGRRLEVDFSHCWTCYRGGDRACLTCPSCAERLRAFELNGVRDPLDWREG